MLFATPAAASHSDRQGGGARAGRAKRENIMRTLGGASGRGGARKVGSSRLMHRPSPRRRRERARVDKGGTAAQRKGGCCWWNPVG